MALRCNIVDWDVKQLVSPVKLTLKEVCDRFNLDFENDYRIRMLYVINITQRVLIKEEMLDFIGYAGSSYHIKKVAITKLLNSNRHIKYREIIDENDVRKKYYLLNALDFESLMTHMRTPKIVELRHLFSQMKYIMTKYCEYEKYYEQRNTVVLLRQENNQLVRSVQELKDLVTVVKTSVDDERKKAEIERKKAEDERKKTEDERKKAEERSAILSAHIDNNSKILQSEIASRQTSSPDSTNKNKHRHLGLFATMLPNEWYLMNRQEEGWRDAEKKLIRRGMRLLHRWNNIAHAVDIGNCIKQHYRNEFSWYARGNLIRSQEERISDNNIIDVVEKILLRENEAHSLATMNETHIYHKP